MKKLIYLLMVTAALSISLTSCKDKKDDDMGDDDYDDVTLVITDQTLA